MKGNRNEKKEPSLYYSQVGNWSKKIEEQDEYSNEVSFNGETLYDLKEH